LGRLGAAHLGRIEQEGVFAHQAPAVPAQFEQHVDERFVDRLGRGDLDELARAALLDREAQRAQGWIEFDVRQAEGVGRRQLGAQAARLVVRHRRQFDFGIERLAQRRQHGQLAQTRRVGRGR